MNTNKIILIGGLIIGFITTLLLSISNAFKPIDNYVYNAISSIQSPFMTKFMTFITKFADAVVIVILSIVVGLIILKTHNFNLFKSYALNMGISNLLAQLLKRIVKRTRPNVLKLVEETGYSFPSGHTVGAMTFYGFLIIIILNCLKGSLKLILVSILVILIFLIGFSRIYLGVHYFSDVLGSILLSSIFIIIFNNSFKFSK